MKTQSLFEAAFYPKAPVRLKASITVEVNGDTYALPHTLWYRLTKRSKWRTVTTKANYSEAFAAIGKDSEGKAVHNGFWIVKREGEAP